MTASPIDDAVALKLDLLFDGVRFSPALLDAAHGAFPNFFPYRFAPGEPDPTGTGKADIPYMLYTPDGMHCRIKVAREAQWVVGGSRADGFHLRHDDGRQVPVAFEPAYGWMQGTTRDGLPRLAAGISLHGDMAVLNPAPGCEYFTVKPDGQSMRCTFCTYGAPDARLTALGQTMGRTDLPESTYDRLAEVLALALDESPLGTLYLVGGSLTDPREEGRRFVEIARRVQRVNRRRVPVTCGSGALPAESLQVLHDEGLVDAVCFDLEVWSQPLFAKICPGKDRFVGYERWIASLEEGVRLWGAGRVYSAMVAGIELGPEVGMTGDAAVALALRGVEDLCGRGILPIYSPYWPPFGRELPEHLREFRQYFEALQLGYHAVRRRHGLAIWDGFLSRRSAYMQLECDVDWAFASAEAS